MAQDLGVSLESAGWLVSAGQLGYLVGLIFLVPLGDVVDRRRLMVIHLLLTAAGLIVVAAASTAWVAFAGLAATGLFAVVVQTAVAYSTALSAPSERGRTLGIVTSGVVIGILGARILAGFLADVWGWRSIYMVLAILAVALASLVPILLPLDTRPKSANYSALIRSLAGLFIRPVFLSRGLIAFFLFASFGALWSGMALPLAGAPWHLSQTQIGLLGIAGLAGALGAARAGRWADAGRSSFVTGIALAILLVSWLATGQLGWSLILLILGVVLLDFAVQAVHVINQHILTTIYADRISTTIGAYMIFYSLGSALGAATTTALYAAAGWRGSASLGAAFAACGLLVWTLTSRTANHAVRRNPLQKEHTP